MAKLEILVIDEIMIKLSVTSSLVVALILSGCVSAGYEGQVGGMVSMDQIFAQREARQTVEIFETVPSDYRQAGEISVRRCHRNFGENPPTISAFEGDLVLAAFAQGADAVSNIRIERMNGLLANCWYVEEATADIYMKQ